MDGTFTLTNTVTDIVVEYTPVSVYSYEDPQPCDRDPAACCTPGTGTGTA